MKKGFTLIELLAVIVILAVIALIASPIIIGLIDNARKEAFKNTGYGIIDAGKLLYSKELLKGTNEEVIFTYSNGIEISTISGKTLDYNGAKPKSGIVIINNEGQVAVAIHNENYCAKKGYYDSEVILTEETPDDCNIPLYADNTGAPIPELTAGMIPVVYNGTNWIKANVIDKWYDYDKQEWANVVTVNNAVESGTGSDGVPRHSRDYYINTLPVGEPISMDDINTMWVWIPRYKYKLFNVGTEIVPVQQIDIAFESKITTKSTGKVDNVYTINELLTHPAFWWDNNANGLRENSEEVSGLWIGKFETTGSSDSPTILPNKTSIIGKTPREMFEASRKMEVLDVYGWEKATEPLNTNGSLTNDPNDIDIHMVKDSEWGVVAYLSQSKYGKYGNPLYDNTVGKEKEIYKNNINTDLGTGYGTSITGCAGDTVNAGMIRSATCPKTNQYYTSKGIKASTTGNVYGVFDMNGGIWEYTMSKLNPSNVDNSGFGATSDTGSLPLKKYWSEYSGTAPNLCDMEVCYGYALSETRVWYGDDAYNWHAFFPWSFRGGNYNESASAGVFNFGYTDGDSGNSSFRVVLLKL